MINKNTIKHLQDISMPAKQVCLVQVPTLAIAGRHDFQISFEFIWYFRNLWKVCFDSTLSFTCLGAFSRLGANLTVTTLESIHHDWFKLISQSKRQHQKCVKHLKSTSSLARALSISPYFPQWLPQLPGAEDMMTIQPQIKLAIGVILTNPAPPQLLFSITQSNEKNRGENANLLGYPKISSSNEKTTIYTGVILRQPL